MGQVAVSPDEAEAAEEAQRVWPINVNKSLLIVRTVVGLLFIGHALQKLLGWFGGDGLTKWTDNVQGLGLQPAPFWASFEAAAELVGGVCLVLGLLTPLAAAMIIGDMVVATLKVHAPKGLWAQTGGYEYNLVLMTILFAIGLIGPGWFSLDRRLPVTLPRPWTFLVALGVSLLITGYAILTSGPAQATGG